MNGEVGTNAVRNYTVAGSNPAGSITVGAVAQMVERAFRQNLSYRQKIRSNELEIEIDSGPNACRGYLP